MKTSPAGIAMIKTSKHHPCWNAVVALLVERDGERCAICNDVLAGAISIDHIVPKSRGGADLLSNFRLTHHSCNVSHFRTNFKAKRNPQSEEMKKKMAIRMKQHWEKIRAGDRRAPVYGDGVRQAGALRRWANMTKEQRTMLATKIWITRHENQRKRNCLNQAI